MRYYFACVLLVILFSCTRKQEMPPGILKQEKMQEVFWDFVRAEVYTTYYTTHDSARSEAYENLRIQERIFKDHKITKDEFYRSYSYYSNRKELMTQMIDSMMARKKREKNIKPAAKPEIKNL